MTVPLHNRYPRSIQRLPGDKVSRLIGGSDYLANFAVVHRVEGPGGKYEVWARPSASYFAGLGYRGIVTSERHLVGVEVARRGDDAKYEVVVTLAEEEAGKQWRRVEGALIERANKLAKGEQQT